MKNARPIFDELMQILSANKPNKVCLSYSQGCTHNLGKSADGDFVLHKSTPGNHWYLSGNHYCYTHDKITGAYKEPYGRIAGKHDRLLKGDFECIKKLLAFSNLVTVKKLNTDLVGIARFAGFIKANNLDFSTPENFDRCFSEFRVLADHETNKIIMGDTGVGFEKYRDLITDLIKTI